MAVNGVCLTATELTERSFAADLSAETQKSTTLGGLRTGAKVNLERPVTASDPPSGIAWQASRRRSTRGGSCRACAA